MVRALLAQHYGRLNTTTGYVAYILDMWHMSCCQCADRGNGTNLYILLCPCPNTSHCTGAPSCPFRCSNPRSLQHRHLGGSQDRHENGCLWASWVIVVCMGIWVFPVPFPHSIGWPGWSWHVIQIS